MFSEVPGELENLRLQGMSSSKFIDSCASFFRVNIYIIHHWTLVYMYTQSKLKGTQRKGRYYEVKSSELSWAGQYKKYLQYDLRFTLECSDIYYSVEFKQNYLRFPVNLKSSTFYVNTE